VLSDGQVAAEAFLEHHRHAELFLALTDERLLIGLAGIDLAAGQLPVPRERRRLAPLRDKDVAEAVEERNPHHDLPGHGGHDRAMPEQPALLSAADVQAELRDLSGWSGDTSGIERTVECPSFPAAVELVGQVAIVAEEMNHHPDIDIRWRNVRFAVSTHSAGGVTAYDIELARRINRLASSSKS
jgi:4a-hydroxytetrahydrobiopterin dehydratase